MCARWRDDRRKLSEELERGQHHDARLTALAGSFGAVEERAVATPRKPIERDGRAAAVTEETLKPETIILEDVHVSV
jgi:hypothetical protein